jgi:hypothetical protein
MHQNIISIPFRAPSFPSFLPSNSMSLCLENGPLLPQGRLARLCPSRSVFIRPPPYLSFTHSLQHPPGIPATWLSFIPFASAIGTYWASVLYCLAVTLLEIIFGLGTFLNHSFYFSRSHPLGMIWKMTPSKMPYGFCVTQTVVMALSFYVLTGVCGCFTWASYLTVFKPYRSIQASAS